MSIQNFVSRIVTHDEIFIETASQAKAALEYAEIKTEMEYKDFEGKLVDMSREETEHFLNQAQNT
ncbi:hypothetical protein [Pseudomonas sp. Xaverov 259]|uniref:hypothetical protein n=1 Tax=Pseudomonas sp. Xaverov 259 TaxID=2666086 RepID=UPI001C5B4D88|nr:hypothetical protein [Pseudomonas sp. Xaverov 259]